MSAVQSDMTRNDDLSLSLSAWFLVPTLDGHTAKVVRTDHHQLIYMRDDTCSGTDSDICQGSAVRIKSSISPVRGSTKLTCETVRLESARHL